MLLSYAFQAWKMLFPALKADFPTFFTASLGLLSGFLDVARLALSSESFRPLALEPQAARRSPRMSDLVPVQIGRPDLPRLEPTCCADYATTAVASTKAGIIIAGLLAFSKLSSPKLQVSQNWKSVTTQGKNNREGNLAYTYPNGHF
ncbi:hypothetical protein BKA59DRAFT_460241 [Fusarium tricinctum]|uniref:Uncharacterized protein n=1 Tax=Fusarium tricinctum TaxID=61284 RepID=A0A8K0RME5_9HYPO|nr:hypothetical protein BKA59DRAFT_460241 [Fusarium tricinctum]